MLMMLALMINYDAVYDDDDDVVVCDDGSSTPVRSKLTR